MPEVFYCRGATVTYKDSPYTVMDSYWRNDGTPGWFYDLGSFQLEYQLKGIPESQLMQITNQTYPQSEN